MGVLNFRTRKRERHLIEGSDARDPHAATLGLVRAFIAALLSGRPEDHLTAPEESFPSHLVSCRRSAAHFHHRPPKLTTELPVVTTEDVFSQVTSRSPRKRTL